MKFFLKSLCVLLPLLAAVLTWNTLRLPATTPPAASPAALTAIDETGAAQRLAEALRIATVSYEDRSRIDGAALEQFATFLQSSFPKTHATLTREFVGHSLLYTWRGSDAAAQPILLLAHMDVVPVEPGTESAWTHAPFGGEIADGYIWGRGALDDKNNLMAWMETIESLLAQGFTPRRTLYFAFGHDEEIGGLEGAAKIAALLKSRGVHAEFALDEGGAITRGVVAGIARPVASIMAAEKGYVTFRLTAHAVGGHSSLPTSETAIGELARAVTRVRTRHMPGRLAPPVTDMLMRLAPEMPLARRVAIANRWLFSPLLVAMLSRDPVGNALVRTTTAPTVFQAGVKDNVLPSEAYALINFRLLPGDSLDEVARHVRLAVADDRIEIRREGAFVNDASAVSRTDTPAFALLARSVNQVFPDALVATGLVFAATDERHYAGLYDSRYNFSPNPFEKQDLARVHGSNERISVQDYAGMIRYYTRLLQNAAAAP